MNVDAVLHITESIRDLLRHMGFVNQLDTPLRSPKLSEALVEKRSASFASLAPLPSNVEAIEAALQFATGGTNLVALVGSSGWGKSHLVNAVEYRLRQDGKECVPAMPADKFLEGPSKHNTANPLLLDDCQEVLGKSRLRTILQLAVEQRVRSARPTLVVFTCPKITRQIRSFLPHARDWSICHIGIPEPSERMLLINLMADEEGLTLSPSLVRVMAHELHGNGRTLSGALKRLRLSGASWQDGPSTLRACGLLEPFFADNSSWDLKHKILKASETSRASFSKLSSQDLAIYAMLRIASLSEADVARAVGAEPAAVYIRATRFERDMERDPSTAAMTRRFVDLVVGMLSED